jgi:hypothetical protein
MSLQSLVSQMVNPVVLAPVKKPKAVKAATKAQKPAKPAKAQKPAKPVKAKLEAFTVFYKESRKKFMAVNALGRTEAARPTAESALAFLKNKYGVEGKVLK